MVVLLVVQNGSLIYGDTASFSFFKSKTNLASKYDKYVNQYNGVNQYREYALEVYWQVTRSDSTYSSLAQTETHRQIWFVREDEQEQPYFSIISGSIKVPLNGSISDYIDVGKKNFNLISMEEMGLAKLLGLDEKQLDKSDLEGPTNKQIFLRIGDGHTEENSFTFKLVPEDYYEVRIELKMHYNK